MTSLTHLVVASPIGAMVGHMILHFGMLRRGVELPTRRSAYVHVPHNAS